MTRRPLRALFVSPHGHAHGGAENQLATLARTCDPQRLDPSFVLLAPGELTATLRGCGHQVVELPAGRIRDARRGLAVVRTLRETIATVRPDIVVSWLPLPQLYLTAARTPPGPRPRCALWVHDTNGERILRGLAEHTPLDAIIACSAAAHRRDQAARSARRRIPRHVVHPGVDVAEPTTSRAEIRARLGIPDGRAAVGVVGRLVRRKNVDGVLQAVARLRAAGTDVHLVVVGGDPEGVDPEYGPQLRTAAAAPDLRGAVTFTGVVPQAAQLFPGLDVLVHAAASEDFGLTVVEAMALGVPVVAVDRDGPAEIAGSQDAAQLVPDGSPQALADGLATVLRDPVRADLLRRRGRDLHAAQFTGAAMAERATTVLHGIAEAR